MANNLQFNPEFVTAKMSPQEQVRILANEITHCWDPAQVQTLIDAIQKIRVIQETQNAKVNSVTSGNLGGTL